jgi:hypothetical protein
MVNRSTTLTMKSLSFSALALFITLAFTGCKNADNSSTSSVDSVAQAPKAPKRGDFKSEVKLLKDSTDFYWSGIESMTQQKYKDMDRLLLEISYTDKPNVIELNKCRSRLKEISVMKLDPHKMESSEIDHIDAAEDSLINRCFTLASNTPGIEQHTIVNDLINDINTANGEKLVAYRARYDYYAQQLNKVIDKDKKKLEKMGAPYSELTSYKYFTIGL